MKPDGIRNWLSLLDCCVFRPAERLLAALLRLIDELLEACPMSLGQLSALVAGWIVAALIVARVSGVGAFVMIALLAVVLWVACRRVL